MIQIQGAMLATGYNKNAVKFPCMVEQKLDGCLQGGSKLITPHGYMTIREIVDNKIQTDVLTYDEEKGVCFKPITNWFDNGLNNECWYTIQSRIKKLTCTGNHKIYTERGYVNAERLDVTDKILFKCLSEFGMSILNGMLFGDAALYKDRRYNLEWRTRLISNNIEFLKHKIELLGLCTGHIEEYQSGYGSKCYKTDIEAVGCYINPEKYMEFRSQTWKRRKCIPVKELLRILNEDSLSVWYADDGCLAFNNGNKNTPIIQLSTHRYTIQQLREFIKYFVIKYDCCPSIIKDKRVDDTKGGYGAYLKFCTEDTFKLLNILRTRVLKGVEYKYYYKDFEYLSGNPIKAEFCEIENINISNRKERKYDIEVADTHCYFANNILVHNCRAICLIGNDDKVHILSRGGKEYDVPHLREWAENHRDLLPLDGELYNHDELTFQQICSAVKCYSAWTEKLRYVVYDKPLSGYTNGMRRMLLMREFKDIKDGPVSLVFNKVAHSYEEIERWHEVFVQQGYEGAIIRNMDGKYVAGRSGNLMKLKRFDTTEFTILDVVEAAGQDKGTGLFILSASGGNRFHARPTGPKSLRASYLRDRESLKGKQCTVRHFGYTDGGVIPRFPVALGVRDYE